MHTEAQLVEDIRPIYVVPQINIDGPYVFNKLFLSVQCCCPWKADNT